MNYEIVLDHGETANKCTITPLRDRADFRFVSVFGEGPLGPLSAALLLHHDGKSIVDIPRPRPIATLASVDCVWRRLPKILPRLRWAEAPAVLAKIPDGFVTAYPRTGRPSTDPAGGLATVEAIFIAAALLGNWDPSLLSRYYFGRVFVQRNAKLFLDLGVPQAGDESQWPAQLQPLRNSYRRNANRGRLAPDRARDGHLR